MNKFKTYLPLALLALPLLLGGGAKLAGVPQLHASFAVLGLPAWFGYFIGVAEVAGAVGLFVPRLQRPAAAGLVPILAGALYFHLRHTPVSGGLPAFVLLGLALWLTMRRPQAGVQQR